MKTKALTLILGALLLTAGIAVLWPSSRSAKGQQVKEEAGNAPSAPQEPQKNVERVEITPQATFGVLMEEAGVTGADVAAIYAASQDVYDLATIRAGKTLDLYYDPTGSGTGTFSELVYALNDEEELHVRK